VLPDFVASLPALFRCRARRLARPVVFTNGVFDISIAATSPTWRRRELGASLVIGRTAILAKASRV
jgi:hypothetical protein